MAIKPIIGISGTQLLKPVEVFEGESVAYIPQKIIEGLQKAGASPIMLPVGNEENAKEYIALIDGLVLSGGFDVDPLYYGEEPHRQLQALFPQRDAFELALIQEAIRKGIPIRGICRGMQLLNVYFGGSLYQDLESQYQEGLLLHIQKPPFHIPVHGVEMKKGSRLYSLMGASTRVNSLHHQAIKELGKGLEAVAKSADGIIEAVEAADPNLDILAVQWHPESMITDTEENQSFFDDLVQQAGRF